jgi:hypothetical protein
MKFYKFETNHSQLEIDRIVINMTSIESEQIDKLFRRINCVEYTDKDGNECMFAILNDSDFDNLCSVYDKYSIKYKFSDLSEKVLFDLAINTKFKNSNNFSVSLKIKRLMKNYRRDWLTTDVVLDKILSLGIRSLNDFDYVILKRH